MNSVSGSYIVITPFYYSLPETRTRYCAVCCVLLHLIASGVIFMSTLH